MHDARTCIYTTLFLIVPLFLGAPAELQAQRKATQTNRTRVETQVNASQGQSTEAEPKTSSHSPVPGTHPAHREIANAIVAFRQGRLEAALQQLEAVAAKHKDLAPGAILFAHVSFASNQVVAGRQALESAALKHADDPELWNMLADLAMRQGRLAEAEILFQEALATANRFAGNATRRRTQTIKAHAGLARVYEQRRQWNKAEAELRTWIKEDAANAAARIRLARVFLHSGRDQEATQTLETLCSLDENQPPADILLGRMLQQLGDVDRATAAMKRAVAKHGDDFQTMLAAARWALTSANQEMLIDCINKAAELDPESIAVRTLDAMSKRFAGKSRAAEEIFREMLTKNPASFDAANGLARSLLEQDDPERHHVALQHAQVNISRYKDLRTPRGRAAAATLAWALLNTGQTVEAEQVIQAVLKSGEISPEVGYIAALTLHARGHHTIAKKLLSAALSSSVAFPQQHNARNLMQKLVDNA